LIVADTTQFYFEDRPLEDRLPFTIVGTGVIPVSGGQARLGRGATTTVGGLQRFFPEAGPEVMWVRVEPDVDPFSVVTAVAEELGAPPPSRSEILGAADFDDQLFTVRRVDKVPLVLAGLVGVMAAGVLAHVVVTGIRARRRDLALLRTVGFVRRQVWATIGWQATVLTAMAVVVAVPVGVVAGRVAWRLYAEALGVVPEPVVPVQALLITAVVVFVVANLVALVPAWRAGRSRIGDVLRTE